MKKGFHRWKPFRYW